MKTFTPRCLIKRKSVRSPVIDINFTADLLFPFREMHIADVDIFQVNTTFYQFTYRLWRTANQEDLLMWCSFADDVNGFR